MIEKWVKIGEVVRSSSVWQPGIYTRYAVMERIMKNGFRKYKEVRMCSWHHSEKVESQPKEGLLLSDMQSATFKNYGIYSGLNN